MLVPGRQVPVLVNTCFTVNPQDPSIGATSEKDQANMSAYRKYHSSEMNILQNDILFVLTDSLKDTRKYKPTSKHLNKTSGNFC